MKPIACNPQIKVTREMHYGAAKRGLRKWPDYRPISKSHGANSRAVYMERVRVSDSSFARAPTPGQTYVFAPQNVYTLTASSQKEGSSR